MSALPKPPAPPHPPSLSAVYTDAEMKRYQRIEKAWSCALSIFFLMLFAVFLLFAADAVLFPH